MDGEGEGGGAEGKAEEKGEVGVIDQRNELKLLKVLH